jgi:hypothetical protein
MKGLSNTVIIIATNSFWCFLWHVTLLRSLLCHLYLLLLAGCNTFISQAYDSSENYSIKFLNIFSFSNFMEFYLRHSQLITQRYNQTSTQISGVCCFKTLHHEFLVSQVWLEFSQLNKNVVLCFHSPFVSNDIHRISRPLVRVNSHMFLFCLLSQFSNISYPMSK